MNKVLVLRAEAPGRALVLQTVSPTKHVVAHRTPSVSIKAVGVMGRPGHDGTGDGITYIQENEPLVARQKETWYNPVTLQLKVYDNGAFRSVAPDGGFF